MSADVLVNGDYELSLCTTENRLIVRGGDIAHSLGDPQQPVVGDICTEVPIDALRVSITFRDGTTHTKIAASHVMIGGWLRGRLVCVSNGGFIGRRNVSPRAHPNDGFLDLMFLDSSMGLQQRFRARQKSILGTHTPHPLVETGRSRSIEFSSLSRTEVLQIDGRRIREWTSVHIEIVPDYWRLLV
jgi:diacylglycerol kinase family enzyme